MGEEGELFPSLVLGNVVGGQHYGGVLTIVSSQTVALL